MSEEKKQDSKEAELVEVPTQTALVFKLEDEKVVDEKGLLLKMYNDIQKIKRSLV